MTPRDLDRFELWIWPMRWEDFQHYRPQRDRAPKWIKDDCGQLDDERYLNLSLRHRGALLDIRKGFSRARCKLPSDLPRLSQRVGARITALDLKTLIQAGFIELCSREVLEQRLEKLYSSPRAPARSREVEVEVEENLKPFSNKTRNGPKPLVCPHDQLEFKTQAKLTDHLRNVHDADVEEDIAF